MPTGTRRFAPHAAMTAMIAIWGASYAVVKVTLGSLSPFAVIALRFWLAVVCLLPFVRSGFGDQLRRARGPGLAAGACLALGYLLQTVGMQGTSASMGGFLAGLIVPLVAIGGRFVFGARFGPRSVAGLFLGMAGVACLCWPSGDPAQTDTPLGIGLQIGSSLSYAGHVLLLSRFGKDAPTVAFCLWQLVVVALAGSAAALVSGELAAPGQSEVVVTWGLGAAILYLGVLATALGIGVQSLVQHRVPPVHLALLFATQPLFAAFFGWLALADALGPVQLLGGAVIIAGVVLTSLDRK
ncbi:MAG: DMT family transporter [Planctomycetes bacterium]|nr:DMT family transporter [Planctomycetota bacterium]